MLRISNCARKLEAIILASSIESAAEFCCSENGLAGICVLGDAGKLPSATDACSERPAITDPSSAKMRVFML